LFVQGAKDAVAHFLPPHYAEGHQGICVRFNADLELIASAIGGEFMPIEVQYSTDFPRIQFYH